jgi:hypothetical protein
MLLLQLLLLQMLAPRPAGREAKRKASAVRARQKTARSKATTL